ncbi:conserved protein of unknown function [Tenacibaculum sp. 190130A14a]|uniref:Signal transduction histidine kinase internal region domain-containing protein n=1 Tax=Tenacibaculum polynesiense TaxID=3137857 RepID=A0ABP1EV34_9FLAO
MKRILLQLLFSFIVFFGCQKRLSNLEEPNLPHYYNTKVYLETDSLNYYLEELENIPKEHLSDSLKAEYSFAKSRFNYSLGKYDEAINILNYVTSFTTDRIKSDREVLFFRALSLVYYRKKNDYLSAEKINEKLLALLKDDDYKNKAFVYQFKHNVKLALEEYEGALAASKLAADYFLKAGDTANHGMSKISNAVLYSTLKNQEKAGDILDNFKFEHKLDSLGKYQLYASKGYYYNKNGFYNKAIVEFDKALFFTKQLKQKNLIKQRLVNNYINLSNSYIGLKKYNIAEQYLDSVYNLGISDIEYDDQRAALKKSLEVSHYRKENLTSVMAKLDSIFKYQDKNYSERIDSELKASKVAFEKEITLEKEKREAEIESFIFERNQYILAVLLLLAIVIGILVLNFYRQRKFKIEQDNFLLHQRLLRSQMNPHFTFNSLSLIKNNIEDDKEKSLKYIQKFSKLLRAIFENSTKNYVPIEDELESLQNYIELQQFRFQGRFNYSIENTINEEDEVLIPPMLLQPFVENAILHAFKKEEVTGNIKIQLELENKFLSCIIDDDGVGIDENGLNKKSSVKLIDEFLKKMTGKGIIIVNKKELNKQDRGTKVLLKIPYKLY